jgi:hypothetical protein
MYAILDLGGVTIAEREIQKLTAENLEGTDNCTKVDFWRIMLIADYDNRPSLAALV